MADPTSVLTRSFKDDVSRFEGTIKSAEALVIGGLIAVNQSTGKVQFMDDAQYLMPVGVAVKQKDGDNDNLTGDAGGTYGVVTRAGIVLENVSVTGASAITDLFKLVYATDGQVMSLTRPTTGLPIGFVKKWNATTYCNVQLFSLEGQRILNNIPTKNIICIGRINSHSLEANSAANMLEVDIPQACNIEALYAKPEAFDTGLVAGSLTFNLEIDAVDVTGGVLTLAFGDANAEGDLATKISATAITALNKCKTGSVLQLERVNGGTGFTASKDGWFALYIEITPIPGA